LFDPRGQADRHVRGWRPGLYQVNVTEGPGGGVKILNQPAPPPFKESVRCAEQNLYARAKELVGDRDPRSHEFSVQLRAFDSAKSGSSVGVAVLVALCSSLLQKSIKGGLAVTGGLNLGGSIEMIYNPVAVVENAIEKGASSILMPISSRRQLNELLTIWRPRSPSTTTSMYAMRC
jgi:ATP-dependent Lon protease